jgi:hypothetical protein
LADSTGDVVERRSLNVVNAVFDSPVATLPNEQLFSIRLVVRQIGDGVTDFCRRDLGAQRALLVCGP